MSELLSSLPPDAVSEINEAMTERLFLVGGRPPHAPTPVNPHTLWDIDDTGEPKLYSLTSLDRVAHIIGNKELLAIVSKAHLDFIQSSGFHAHAERCRYNDGKMLQPDADAFTRKLFSHAENGSANPLELLLLLANAPYLDDTELARLTHPFDRDATYLMDQQVTDSIKILDADAIFHPLSKSNERIETELLDAQQAPDLDALIIARKHLYASLTVGGERLHIYRRRIRSLDVLAPDAPESLRGVVPLLKMQSQRIAGCEKQEKEARRKMFRQVESEMPVNLSKEYSEIDILMDLMQRRLATQVDTSEKDQAKRELDQYVAEVGTVVNDELNAGKKQWLQPITTSYFALTHERATELAGKSAKSAAVFLP